MPTLKITQTDHGQQSLVMFPQTKCIIREGMEAIQNDRRLDSLLRDAALQLQRFIEDVANEDHPALFTKTHGSMINCMKCLGTGNEKQLPRDRDADIEYDPCPVCKGEGQLYYEITRKYYVPTETHRKKLTK